MIKSIMSCLLLTVLLTVSLAEAQQPKKVARIGFLSATPASAIAPRVEAFREGLRDLRYIENQNITTEYRYADGKPDRLSELAAELVRLQVEIIVSGGPAATRAAKEATLRVPIVMAWDIDPVGSGLIDSLARPGGNITGLSSFYPEISGKQLELLKEIVPRLSRVAVLGDSNNPGHAQALRHTELSARAFGVQLQYLEVQHPKDIEPAFRAVSKDRADAVVALGSSVLLSQRIQVVELVGKNRLVAIYSQREFLEAGGLMTYGPNFADLWRHAATYVDKILKGAKPANLPVEQPTKFEFIINLNAANQLGLTIPPNVLARADKIIR